jgi:arylsulfatase A-like enzyme
VWLVEPIERVSMVYTFDKTNADAPSKHDTQYFEMFANRAIYHDGWMAATTPPAAPWILGTAKLPDMTGLHKHESQSFRAAWRK